MDKYSTSCTKEQTEKAYRLGAPLKKHKGMVYTNTEKSFYGTYKGETLVKIDKSYFHIPTTEQMCGWLREKNIHLIITPAYNGQIVYYHFEGIMYPYNDEMDVTCYMDSMYNTYEQAVHAAIDAALDYLEKGE